MSNAIGPVTPVRATVPRPAAGDTAVARGPLPATGLERPLRPVTPTSMALHLTRVPLSQLVSVYAEMSALLRTDAAAGAPRESVDERA
jgi:hypothetical protein